MLSSFPTKGPLFLIDKKVCKFRNLNSALNFVLKERAGEGIGSITSRYIFIWLMPFCALRSLGKLYCKVVNAYLHVGVSIVYASIFKVGRSRHFSFTLATQHFALFL